MQKAPYMPVKAASLACLFGVIILMLSKEGADAFLMFYCSV